MRHAPPLQRVPATYSLVDKEIEMQAYINNRAGFILGRHRAKGAEVEMTEAQARLYLTEGRISAKPRTKRASPVKKPTPVTLATEDPDK